MDRTYEWLFENYAEDLQPGFREYERKAIGKLAQSIPLTDLQRIQLEDCLADIRFHSGVASFSLGVQFALRLTMDYWREFPDSTAF